MASRTQVELPPSDLDVAIARGIADRVRPAFEDGMGVVTWLADEKLVLAAAAVVWLDAYLAPRQPAQRRRADRLLASTALAGALPHLIKRWVNRKRPDRSVVHVLRHGIPRSGNAWDSFPSGHAVHLGAAAAPLRAMVPSRLRPLVWPALALLASTRLLLLAHYPSDVGAGLALGVLLDKAVARALRGVRRAP